jgi:putative cell wall-binding protein
MKKFFFTFILLILIFFVKYDSTLAVTESYLRLGGKDRFEVAVNVSKQGWPNSNSTNTVFISNYLAFADALSATPLAYKLNAPILLTHKDYLTEITKQEINRLKPSTIYIVGGPGSVSQNVYTTLKTITPDVRRIGGDDRFEVAYNISKYFSDEETAIVTNGLVFSDALAIAPYAARQGLPILLTRDHSLPTHTVYGLEGKSDSIVVGGTPSVSDNVYDNLPSPIRIGGADRYEVSTNIIERFKMDTSKAFVATGLTFADALTGSVLAAKENAPLLLTRSSSLPTPVKSLVEKNGIWNFTILGGPPSVGSGTVFGNQRWKISNSNSYYLQGYASKDSVEHGSSIDFYIHSRSPYKIEFYRMGYYEGSGAILMKTQGSFSSYIQNAETNSTTMDANWSRTSTFTVPSNWPSGFYLAKLIANNGYQSFVPFVVTEKNPSTDYGIVISTNTYQAYNSWGGKSLYGYNSTGKTPSVRVSFDRPYKDGNGAGEFFKFEYNFIRWIGKNNYDVTYYSDTDIDNGKLNNSIINALLIPGHDEYWTKAMRDNIEYKMDRNMNLGVFNANVGYWQIRYENDDRTIVAYKSKALEADPYMNIDPSQVTTMFRLSPVDRPEERLFGIMYQGIPEKTMPLVITNSSHWIYNGTNLKNGDKIYGVVGGEVDRYNSVPNVSVIAHSPVTLYGANTFSDVVWYARPEGGNTFAVGTFYWNWFLDNYGHTSNASYNKNIDIMTKNVLTRLKN